MPEDHNIDIEPELVGFLHNHGVQGMVTQLVVVASFLDEDGDTRWSLHTRGNGQISNAVGLLEFAKDDLIRDMREESFGA